MNNQSTFYFETTGSFTGETSHREDGKKYLLAGLDAHNIIARVRFQTQLICPDDNSILASHIKNDPDAKGCFATPVANIEFKPNFYWKGKNNYSAFQIKDISQVKKVELEKPAPRQVAKWPPTQFTFKVLSQKKSEVDERGEYEHELEIEPFSLGIEGLPEISQIIFDFSSPLPGQIEAEGRIKDTKLYNSKLLAESAGKTFTMKIRRWKLLEGNKTLSFYRLSDFDLDSFQEKTTEDNPNNPPAYNILKEKILRNLDKICLDPIGYLANAELMKNQTFAEWAELDWSELSRARSKKGFYKIKDENGEEVNLEPFFNWPNWESARENYQEIGKAIVAKIKNNPTDWEIIKESEHEWKVVRNKKTGLKHYQPFFLTTPSFLVGEKIKIWDEIEAILKKSSAPVPSQPVSQNQKESKWYKPTDYPGVWITIILLSLFLLIFIFALVRKAKKLRQI